MIDFAIVIVSFRSAGDLRELLASVDQAAGGRTWHVTVVNNAVDDPLAALLEPHDQVTVVEAGANLGYSGGINVGRRSSPPSRWVVVLNPDLRLHAGALSALGAQLDSGAAAAVPLIHDERGDRMNSLRREPTLLRALGDALFGDGWPQRPAALSETVRDAGAYERPHSIDWATGAALSIRSEVYDAVGDWDSTRFFMYSEETDFARRIRESGGRIDFTPTSVVTHRGGGSGSSPQLDALLEVNKLRYYRKWHRPAASAMFGLILVLRNAIRPHRAGARAALRALLLRRDRAHLPGGNR
ncbi:glycosyltransferase family 2 protein [Microbacterium yannicii]|uniref:Glycosyltransferase family 2 protein n=1 Tax=Microbacterium yannicii TaxID=671622 RepID=A0ABP9LU76_9MICO|nr:glycosyltransferase family 2 protein [Microbacterium yannicii]MCO5952333.1 glycosyltransferase family 2 protein [Microbacterium yannicii]